LKKKGTSKTSPSWKRRGKGNVPPGVERVSFCPAGKRRVQEGKNVPLLRGKKMRCFRGRVATRGLGKKKNSKTHRVERRGGRGRYRRKKKKDEKGARLGRPPIGGRNPNTRRLPKGVGTTALHSGSLGGSFRKFFGGLSWGRSQI